MNPYKPMPYELQLDKPLSKYTISELNLEDASILSYQNQLLAHVGTLHEYNQQAAALLIEVREARGALYAHQLEVRSHEIDRVNDVRSVLDAFVRGVQETEDLVRVANMVSVLTKGISEVYSEHLTYSDRKTQSWMK